jgi:hypothetical protein
MEFKIGSLYYDPVEKDTWKYLGDRQAICVDKGETWFEVGYEMEMSLDYDAWVELPDKHDEFEQLYNKLND